MQKLNYLLSIKDLSAEHIHSWLNEAGTLLTSKAPLITPSIIPHHMANLFFEPSTRTCQSFTMAANTLGVYALNPHLASSSLQKGESVLDMILTMEAMGVNLFVIRHSQAELLASLAPQLHENTALINAGDGSNQHPTQALADLFTIKQHIRKPWSELSVAIMGDIIHSRVAHSLIDGLSLLGTEDIRLIGPDYFLPKTSNIALFDSPDTGLKNVDVIVALRIQKERIANSQDIDIDLNINLDSFHQAYGLTNKRLSLANPEVMVMHPGPINRGVEISSEVADGAHSFILKQVRNALLMRMVLIRYFFSVVIPTDVGIQEF